MSGQCHTWENLFHDDGVDEVYEEACEEEEDEEEEEDDEEEEEVDEHYPGHAGYDYDLERCYISL